MPNTIADIIKNSSQNGMSQAVGSLVNTEDSLVKQAQDILDNDERDFQRLGTNFIVPKNLQNPLNVEFNDFLVEPLLREGSLLLDRCLQQRKEYQELHTKWFEACVQVDELFRLNRITEDEEKAIYDIPSEIETLTKESFDAEKTASTNCLNSAKNNKDENIRQKNGFTPAGALKPEGALNEVAAASGGFNNNPEGSHYGWRSVAYELQKSSYEIDENTARLEGNTAILDKRIEAQMKSIELSKKRAEFQRVRNDVARLVATRRAKQLTKKNGALNFFEQMKPLKDRFNNDLNSAYFRLEAAHNGFKKLYGKIYEDQIKYFPFKLEVKAADLLKPELKDLPAPPQIGDFLLDFDELITWCQLTNTWLASFLDKQQQVTRSFGLKKLINNDAMFEAGKAQSEWRFKLKDTDFANMRFVRMRSFAIQIDSGHQSGNWNVSITPPPKAENDPKEQGNIGTLYLGRVNERTFAVISEGSAPPKLFNASPIGENSPSGEWTIEVLSGTNSGVTVNDIKDIDIHLTVAIV